ncbi:hypothetical protein [Streptomyces sp. URMC 123]|uniref:hypothetical protein n=1 Tax=Streptomyces sp. URMC 123 TaxID=3423403 RepID=UPI003F52C92B
MRVAAKADAQTRQYAKANPQAVAQAATVCGAGYELSMAKPLPDGTDPRMRFATLFAYTKGGNDNGCAILDNNAGGPRKMNIKVCNGVTGDSSKCDDDPGTFSQYAGPVYTAHPVCAKVTATMADSSGRPWINYSTEYAFLCN